MPILGGRILSYVAAKPTTGKIRRPPSTRAWWQKFTRDLKAWKDGSTVAPIDLPEDNPVRASFSTDVLGKSVGNVRAVWAQPVFSGRALPPKQAASDDEVKKLVAANKSASGYVKASSADDSVKVVLK